MAPNRKLSRRPAWLVATLLVSVAALPSLAAEDRCEQWQQQRDALAREAMQAEIEAVHRLRLRICPQQEQQASLRNADQTQQPNAAPFNYEAYIRCREQAEAQLLHSKRVLYRSRLHFTYYTALGAQRAQQADALRSKLESECPARP